VEAGIASRFEDTTIANPRRASEQMKLIIVESQDLVHG
jgi:hypothetical protein